MAFTHILIPTDFSEPATRVLRYALEEATLHHANVTLLHVLPAHTGTDVYFLTGGPGARHGGRYIQQHAAYARKVKKVWQYRCQCSSSMATRL
jgi:nucleotide-binding universal stress UspA family protein